MLLRLDSVSKTFGGLQALESVSMDVESGEIVSLIGPNGAGKSTLLSVVRGMYKATRGKVFFDDADISDWPAHRRTCLGLGNTFQLSGLFGEMTLLDNVMTGRHHKMKRGTVAALLRSKSFKSEEDEVRERALQSLRFVGLDSEAVKMGSELPYGARRICELARALVSEPKLLLLDEPAAGLNPKETDELRNMLIEIRSQGISILLVEHNVRLVMDVSNRVVVLKNGRKIADASPEVVAKHPEVVQAYLGKEWKGADN